LQYENKQNSLLKEIADWQSKHDILFENNEKLAKELKKSQIDLNNKSVKLNELETYR
jgi:hypothetical protein